VKRAARLGVRAALMPVIGGAPRADTARRRSGAALHWRKSAAAASFPELHLTIRPAFQFHPDLGVLQREIRQTLAAAPREREVAQGIPGLRGPAGERSMVLHWLMQPQPESTGRARVLRNTPAAFAAQGMRQHRSVASLCDATDAPPLRGAAPASSIVKLERSAPRTEVHLVEGNARAAQVLDWRLPADARPVSIAAGVGSRPVRTASRRAPVAPVRQIHLWSPEPAEPQPSRLPRAEIRFAAPNARGIQPPSVLAGSIRARRSASAPVAPTGTRRAALDLAWQPRPEASATSHDFAALAQSLSAQGATRTVSVSRHASQTGFPAAPTALPDTGRLVDEVIDRIERRMRSDRLRRGL
jgi:hypothetical protein